MAENSDNKHPHASVEDIVLYIPLMALVGVVAVLFISRLMSDRAREHRRRMCVYSPSHALFTQSSDIRAFFHRHLFHAPVFGYKYNLEYRLFGRRLQLGTTPSRIQGVFLLAYTALNVALCVGTVPLSKRDSSDAAIRRLSSNAGILAVANLIPLVITAGRNNPLIPLLRTSFNKFNLVHRWLGRIVVAEALTHAVIALTIAAGRCMFLEPESSDVGANNAIDGWDGVPHVLFTVDIFIFGFMVRLT